MEYNVNNSVLKKSANQIIISIGINNYRLSEISGELCINKISDNGIDVINITPFASNQIYIK